jgi:cell division protein FtsZ
MMLQPEEVRRFTTATATTSSSSTMMLALLALLVPILSLPSLPSSLVVMGFTSQTTTTTRVVVPGVPPHVVSSWSLLLHSSLSSSSSSRRIESTVTTSLQQQQQQQQQRQQQPQSHFPLLQQQQQQQPQQRRRLFALYSSSSSSSSSSSNFENDDDENDKVDEKGGGGGGESMLDEWTKRSVAAAAATSVKTSTRTSSANNNNNNNNNNANKNNNNNAGPPCVIKVLGVGGGGGNAVNRMIQTRIEGVSFWAINTDAQALAKSLAPNVLNIGRTLTRGLGAGGDPLVGANAARENSRELNRICDGADMIFITAGMGGGTGSGAAPVVADIAKNACGCLTVGVVTKPFAFEGRKRMRQAVASIEELRQHVDTLIVVSNDKLLRIVPDNTPVTDAFLVADDILRQGVVGISEIILKTGLVNVDFADVRAVMKDAGTALMGVGTGVGKNRAADAAVAAISSPLLDFPIQRAKRIVFNIVGGEDMGLQEINQASEVIYENADDNANIIFGALVDPTMQEEISITVLACDFDSPINDDGELMDDNSAGTGYGVKNKVALSRTSDKNDNDDDDGFGRRGANFYKDRRRNTSSPLGPDASLEDTRVAITRGFKKPGSPSPSSSNKVDNDKSKKTTGFRNFIKRKILRRDDDNDDE